LTRPSDLEPVGLNPPAAAVYRGRAEDTARHLLGEAAARAGVPVGRVADILLDTRLL